MVVIKIRRRTIDAMGNGIMIVFWVSAVAYLVLLAFLVFGLLGLIVAVLIAIIILWAWSGGIRIEEEGPPYKEQK